MTAQNHHKSARQPKDEKTVRKNVPEDEAPVKEEKPTTESEKAEDVDQKSDPIDELNAEIEALQSQLAESKNNLLRAYADTDNTRKRLQKEAETAKKYRFQNAALEILPILDNMDLALANVPANEEAATFVKGFEMIRTQLVNALANEGVQEIEALNKPFDANLMQGLMTEKVEGVEPGMVTQVLQKGYKLKDRMLRPALVKVSE